MVRGRVIVSYDTDANAVYYKVDEGKVARTEKARANGLDCLVDYDSKGEVVGYEILNMKVALGVAAANAGLTLLPHIKTQKH